MAQLHALTTLAAADVPAVRSLLGMPVFAREFAQLLATGPADQRWSTDFPAGTSVVMRDPSGKVIGCGLVHLLPLADRTRQALLRLATHPDWQRRGIASTLLREITARLHAMNTSAAPGTGPRIALQALFAHLPCPDAAGFAACHGFTGVRHFHRMERGPQPCPDPVWPEAITLRPFDGTAAMFEAWNTAGNGPCEAGGDKGTCPVLHRRGAGNNTLQPARIRRSC